MPNRSQLRHGCFALLLALALSPVAAQAQSPSAAPADRGAVTPQSPVGVLMAIVCGASVGVSRFVPAPIVVAVAGASCLVALLDAVFTSDEKP